MPVELKQVGSKKMNKKTSLPDSLYAEVIDIARDLLPQHAAQEFREDIPVDQRVLMAMVIANPKLFALIALAPHDITGLQTTTTVTKDDFKMVATGFFLNKVMKYPVKVVETTVTTVEGKKDGQY